MPLRKVDVDANLPLDEAVVNFGRRKVLGCQGSTFTDTWTTPCL
jgi:hypothetical protein